MDRQEKKAAMRKYGITGKRLRRLVKLGTRVIKEQEIEAGKRAIKLLKKD